MGKSLMMGNGKPPVTRNIGMRSGTIRLEIELQAGVAENPDLRIAREAYQEDSKARNFSLYLILFIASQEMFVNCEATGRISEAGASRLMTP